MNLLPDDSPEPLSVSTGTIPDEERAVTAGGYV
jgi:hypothetical protein